MKPSHFNRPTCASVPPDLKPNMPPTTSPLSQPSGLTVVTVDVTAGRNKPATKHIRVTSGKSVCFVIP